MFRNAFSILLSNFIPYFPFDIYGITIIFFNDFFSILSFDFKYSFIFILYIFDFALFLCIFVVAQYGVFNLDLSSIYYFLIKQLYFYFILWQLIIFFLLQFFSLQLLFSYLFLEFLLLKRTDGFRFIIFTPIYLLIFSIPVFSD